MRYLHGFGDEGGEHLHAGKPGWTIISEEIGINTQARGRDFSHISSQGIGVMVRINFSHMGKGTIPLPPKYIEFAAGCGSFAGTSKGVEWWIIGNEPNHEGEAPEGVTPTPEEYARCFALCRDAIKKAVPGAKVMPAAVAPYSANHLPWNKYLARMLLAIVNLGGCDGINIHAYTRGMNAFEITSKQDMGGVLKDTYSGFLVYRNALALVPDSLKPIPSFITEFDAYSAWEDRDTHVITAAYDEIDQWNIHHPDQPILALLCFRWIGLNHIDWRMYNKPQLLQDFSRAVSKGFLSPPIPSRSGSHQTHIPAVGKEDKPMAPTPNAPEVKIDPRIRGEIQIIPGSPNPSNSSVWDIVSIQWKNKEEAGGRRNVYVEFEGTDGEPIRGETFTVHWPSGSHPPTKSNGLKGFDAANQPFTPGRGAFWVTVPNGDTVKGIGMGEMTPDGFNPGHHTVYILTYRRRYVGEQQQPTKPAQPTQPTVPATPPVSVPALAHPVAEPKYRIVTQEFGARPDFYRQYTIDGVPLLGHEGIDFRTPRGSKIVAVDTGTVAEVADQGDKGYGKYIKLIHQWGETVYAHLEEQWVTVGEMVNRGTIIGKSGWTGNVEPRGPAGAHLHFGLRTKPFNRQDGWGGYKNPAPFLINTGTGPTTIPEPSPDKSKLVKLAREAAAEFSVDPELLISLVHGESSFNPLSRNPESGAAGLGNIMPDTWGEWAPKVGASDIFDPQDNLRVTARYLKWCIDLAGGSHRRGLWAYNWSPKAISENVHLPPSETLEFASKVLHGKEVAELVGSQG